ncbi:hypothetical protein HPB52_000754 [Rhipicephalus sanguineus]|uniref:Uncharacterized protein n=1 Tax=Rhipicephalus sanguineus TaxID=34632 RepID=A0A9D4SRN8_RHISA|nr:hypothetical protein HPB52_000754 [Rhipicephalus sanguineus]
MADTPSEDAPDEITVRTRPHATATSRPSAPRNSPAAPMMTRARKLKAAANRLQKGSSSSIPTSRPRVRGIGKLLTPCRRQAPRVKAATAKNAMQTAAAATEEAAATISLAPRPPQLHLVPTQQEGSKAELQDDQEPVALTPAGSEEETSTDSSSPTSSSSWGHNTPLTSPRERALTPRRRQPVLARACWLCKPAGPGVRETCSERDEEKRVTSTGKATVDSLAQAGASQSVTAPPSKGKGPRQKPGRRQHQLDLIGHLVANVPRGTSATILYRPKGRENNFLFLSRDASAVQLSKVPGTNRVCANFRGNVVAVHTTPGADISSLLAVESIGEVAVNAKTANKGTCAGVLHGVDAAFDEEVLKKNIESSAPILSCARTGRNVLLRFAGNAPPDEVALFKQTHPVHARRRRPLQCVGCGAFGHTHATHQLPTLFALRRPPFRYQAPMPSLATREEGARNHGLCGPAHLSSLGREGP